MILIDTSAWIDHFRRIDPALVAVLESGEAACHPFVLGELSMGSLKHRASVLELLAALPMLEIVVEPAVLGFTEAHALSGTGIGWIDAHLLAAAAARGARLLTHDRRLQRESVRLGLAA